MTYEAAYAYIGRASNAYVRRFVAAGVEARAMPQPDADSGVGEDWPCCQTVDGLLYWLLSGEPNENILDCAIARRSKPYYVRAMVEHDFATGRPSSLAAIDMRHWLRQRRHILACELSGTPCDPANMAEFFGAY
jgi:hypothetical protein